MNAMSEGPVQVAILGDSVYLKPCGFATQCNCLAVPDFLDAMFRAGCKYAIFDLDQCGGMDSTFLGVIAHAASALPHRRGKTVAVVNANQRALTQLQRVGLLPLVCLRQEKVETPGGLELQDMSYFPFPKTPYERLERIRDLHQRLVHLNEGNRELFGPFLEMLEEELKRSREQGGKQ